MMRDDIPRLKVGFTGSQRGTQTGQLHQVRSFLLRHDVAEFHHGCCVGADVNAHYEACDLGIPIVYHPPTDTSRAVDLRSFEGTWRKPKPYLERNHDIVDETDVLIACPYELEEVLRSGTWATIHYARKVGKPVYVFSRVASSS